MRVVVKLSEWNGKDLDESFPVEHNKNSRLVNSEGKMCCLGFMCEQLGLSRTEMLGVGFPNNVCDTPFFEKQDILKNAGLAFQYDGRGDWYNTDFARAAAMINDDLIALDAKKARLIRLFAENGHELIFED